MGRVHKTVCWAFALLGLAAGVSRGQAVSPSASEDPVFANIPFERWLKEGDSGHFRWTARVFTGDLSHHQRLRARFEVQIDGNEMLARKGHNQLLLLTQFTDQDNRVFQTHQSLDLDNVKDDAGKTNVVLSQQVFVIPGEYRVAFGILDTKTNEHATLQRPLRIASLRNDPLPDSWSGLPAVEYEREVKPPDELFLPYLTGHLRLPLKTQQPVHVDLLVNAAPSMAPPPMRIPTLAPQNQTKSPLDVPANEKQADVIAAMKVISGIDLSEGMLHVSMLDLARRKVVFNQNIANQHEPRGLDWGRLRGALQEADPNKIDVGSLAHRDESAQFFVEQVLQHTQPQEGGHQALIILSGPTSLSGEDHRAVLAAQRSVGKVYFVRYHTPPPPQRIGFMQDRFGGRQGTLQPADTGNSEAFDSLGGLLKPLQPRVFDVYNPEQFRKALATMMDEISRM